MKNRDVSEAIIVNKNNEFLLQKKTLDYKFAPGGQWTFFGGAIKENETPEQALRREIKEEINYDIEKFTLFKIRKYELPEFGIKGKRYIFEVVFDGNVSQISLGEGGGFAFFSPKELDYININSIFLEDLTEYFMNKWKIK